MKLTPSRVCIWLRIALVTLMLAAQGLAYAHELGHLETGYSNNCGICSIGHGFGSSVNASHDIASIQVERALISTSTIIAIVKTRLPAHFARAPPLSL